ncbi:C-type mannose receptor 2-like [Acanthaster planci]|uniref:C-type mannose receptor 2-like n=1 Tax=Acanthaster planci TaxID=133434 RepID=A0A8B7ZSN0_ACAPL|nr:C-type mannose receptor 2-like [Acanthaster planci]
MAFHQIPFTIFFLALGLAAGVDLYCPPFWTRFGDNCYRFFGPPKTWLAAEEHCQEFFTRNGQGHLASIHSSAENNLLIKMWETSLVPNEEFLGGHVWLGFNDRSMEETFAWSDETHFHYEAWLDGQPDDAGGREDCGAFWRTHNRVGWNDDRCEVTLPYLCKMPKETSVEAIGLAAGVDLDCPPFWTRFRHDCYRFFGPPKTWQAAEEHCREFFTRNGQGHLASIFTSEENDFVLQMWQTSLVPNGDRSLGQHVWLGFNDRLTEGTFTWSNGMPFTFEAWQYWQPDDAGDEKDCGTLWKTDDQVGWNDNPCGQSGPYLCKMRSNMHRGYY